jgi:hypothetical protein
MGKVVGGFAVAADELYVDGAVGLFLCGEVVE